MTFLKYASAVISLLLSSHVNAVLVSADLYSTDDGLITIDTDTGLEWLDFSSTNAMSYNDISAQLTTGGTWDGWRYATVQEIESLLNAAGGNGVYGRFSSAENEGVYANLIDLMFPGYTRNYLRIFMDGPNVTYHATTVINGMDDQGDWLDPYYSGDDTRPYYAGSDISSALVRTSVVPVPAAAWLFASGLMGLIGLARRKKT